jgi:hypothetical protein
LPVPEKQATRIRISFPSFCAGFILKTQEKPFCNETSPRRSFATGSPASLYHNSLIL